MSGSNPVTVPAHADPLVRCLFTLMRHQKIGYRKLADRAGISHASLSIWRRHSNPRLLSFAAALNTLGYELRIVPLHDTSEASKAPDNAAP